MGEREDATNRLAALSRAGAREEGTTGAEELHPTALQRLTFRPGDRVVDPTTGMEGTVVNAWTVRGTAAPA